MKHLLAMVALAFCGSASADALTSATITLAHVDEASDKCDVFAIDKLLHTEYKGVLTIRRPGESTNDATTIDKSDAIEIAAECRKTKLFRSTTSRTIEKAEIVAPGRVILTGNYYSEVRPLDSKEAAATGRFISTMLCTGRYECKMKADAIMVRVGPIPSE